MCFTWTVGFRKIYIIKYHPGESTGQTVEISTLMGEKMSNMNEKRLTLYRRKHLGYIFQMYNLIPNLTVQENIEVGAYLSDKPLEMEELLRTLGLYEHRKNCRTSFRVVSSSVLLLGVQLLKIRTFCFVMNRQARLIIKLQKKS